MFTATLYNRTGFSLFNIPDSEATLNSAALSTKSVPAMDILQLLYNSKITIKAYEEDVISADFLKLTKGDPSNNNYAFYAIDSYEMTSGDTIELSVSMEPILTAGGISALSEIDGSVVRHHIDKPTQTDPSGGTGSGYSNLTTIMDQTPLEEDPLLVPAYPGHIVRAGFPFEASQSSDVQGQYGQTVIILSSVYLDDAADTFVYDVGDPDHPEDGMTTSIHEPTGAGGCNFHIGGYYDGRVYQASNHASQGTAGPDLYAYYETAISTQNEMLAFKKKLAKIAANNLLGVIVHAYAVPNNWATLETAGSIITMVKHADVNPWQGFAYYDTMKSVLESGMSSLQPFLGANNKLIMIATATGEKREYTIDELIQTDGTVKIDGFCDTRPNGGVKFAIKKYKQQQSSATVLALNNDIMDGGGWTQIAISSTGNVGYNINKVAFDAQQTVNDRLAEIQAKSGSNFSAASAWWGEKFVNSISQLIEEKRKSRASEGGYKYGYDLPGEASYIRYTSNADAAIEAGLADAIAQENRRAEKQNEYAQFAASNCPQPISVGAVPTADADIYCNSLIVFRLVPDDRDIRRFLAIQSRFGSRHTTLFKKSYLDNRQNFNYIEMSGCNVGKILNPKKDNKRLRRDIAEALNNGVRIWHTRPVGSNGDAVWSNPYKEGN